MDLENALDKLREDYLFLCTKYQKVIPPEEFGFFMLRYTSRMLMDLAPNRDLGIETIKAGIFTGIEQHDKNPMPKTECNCGDEDD